MSHQRRRLLHHPYDLDAVVSDQSPAYINQLREQGPQLHLSRWISHCYPEQRRPLRLAPGEAVYLVSGPEVPADSLLETSP